MRCFRDTIEWASNMPRIYGCGCCAPCVEIVLHLSKPGPMYLRPSCNRRVGFTVSPCPQTARNDCAADLLRETHLLTLSPADQQFTRRFCASQGQSDLHPEQISEANEEKTNYLSNSYDSGKQRKMLWPHESTISTKSRPRTLKRYM